MPWRSECKKRRTAAIVVKKAIDVFPKIDLRSSSRAEKGTLVPHREITERPEAFRGQGVTRECGVLNTHELEMTPDDTTRTVACFGSDAASLCCHPERVQRETMLALQRNGGKTATHPKNDTGRGTLLCGYRCCHVAIKNVEKPHVFAEPLYLNAYASCSKALSIPAH